MSTKRRINPFLLILLNVDLLVIKLLGQSFLLWYIRL